MVAETSLWSYETLQGSGKESTQSDLILSFLRSKGLNWSNMELSKALHLPINVVSARVNALKKKGKIGVCAPRKCQITGRLVSVVGAWSSR